MTQLIEQPLCILPFGGSGNVAILCILPVGGSGNVAIFCILPFGGSGNVKSLGILSVRISETLNP